MFTLMPKLQQLTARQLCLSGRAAAELLSPVPVGVSAATGGSHFKERSAKRGFAAGQPEAPSPGPGGSEGPCSGALTRLLPAGTGAGCAQLVGTLPAAVCRICTLTPLPLTLASRLTLTGEVRAEKAAAPRGAHPPGRPHPSAKQPAERSASLREDAAGTRARGHAQHTAEPKLCPQVSLDTLHPHPPGSPEKQRAHRSASGGRSSSANSSRGPAGCGQVPPRGPGSRSRRLRGLGAREECHGGAAPVTAAGSGGQGGGNPGPAASSSLPTAARLAQLCVKASHSTDSSPQSRSLFLYRKQKCKTSNFPLDSSPLRGQNTALLPSSARGVRPAAALRSPAPTVSNVITDECRCVFTQWRGTNNTSTPAHRRSGSFSPSHATHKHSACLIPVKTPFIKSAQGWGGDSR